MTENNELQTLYAGRHLSMVARGSWEYITRNTRRPAVGIVAVTDAGNVVLVEQYRPPVGCNVVELPAGLAGDIEGAEHEPFVEAAKRELLEETGYTAACWTELGGGYTSPGLTDETIVMFLAEVLEKQHAGGGDESEEIAVYEVAFEGVIDWLRERDALADLKLFAGLFAAEQELRSRD